MKVHLLYPDRDFDFERPLPPNAEDLVEDLALNALFEAMAQGDEFLFQVARSVVLTSLDEIDAIRYRQEILQDGLRHPEVVRALYEIPMEYLARKREQWLWLGSRHANPTAVLSNARRLLEASLDLLRRLRRLADEHAAAFRSRGFRRFFATIQHELDDEYLALVEEHVRRLRFPRGVRLRARLGRGNEGTDYELCRPDEATRPWLKRLLPSHSPVYSYALHPRDDAGARVLSELRDRGLVRAAQAVARAAEHVESFFMVLRRELAFYLGALHLRERLQVLGVPMTFPEPAPAHERRFSAVDLCDPTLALTLEKRPVGNDVKADGKALTIITGPNRGGKTTFLRSVGVAQLMMQCGLFVAAESLSASLCTGLFTHFRREEDKAFESGKFEEELKRLSALVDHLRPNALLLLNESLAATNEREGSEIAGQVVRALLEGGVRVFYVTFLHEFARRFYERRRAETLFLRAERLPDGTRTFRLKEAEPLGTSYGVDLYRRIFGVEETETVAQDQG